MKPLAEFQIIFLTCKIRGCAVNLNYDTAPYFHHHFILYAALRGLFFPITTFWAYSIRVEGDISSTAPAESSAAIRERVIRAREIQTRRYEGIKGVHCNAQMTTALMHQYAQPDAAGLEKLKDAMTRFNMSARAYDRILRVARTIADLEGSDRVLTYHIQEAIGYRNLDRGNWAERRMF